MTKPMKVIQQQGDQLVWVDSPAVSLANTDDVLIRVHYAGVNRADLMQRAGKYPPPEGASTILGLEVSGEIMAVGTEVTHLRPGDKVCALLTGGGYAEQVVVPAAQVLKLPSGLSLEQAAAVPEAFATAYYNVFMLAELQPGERVLIHAAASGVGTALIQLCRAFDQPCFVTAGDDAKLAFCRKLGADAGWNRHHGEFAEAVNTWGKVNVILDPVGAGYLAANQTVLAQDGRMIVIGLLGGRHDQLDFGSLLMKRQRLIGSTLRNQPVSVKAEIMQQLEQHVWPKFSDGSIQPVVDHVFAVTDVEAAHAYVQANKNTGKVLLKFGE